MRILLAAVLLSIVLIACSTGTKSSPSEAADSTKVGSRDSKASENAFMKFVTLLPKVNLPFEINCEQCCDHPTFDRENELVKKYMPAGSNPVGLIFKNENNVGVLATYAADMLIPAVIVFDMSGKKTDEKTFMTHWCGRDIDFLGIQYFRINRDLTLSTADTTYSFELDNHTQDIIDTLETTIVTTDFYITAEGKIVQK